MNDYQKLELQGLQYFTDEERQTFSIDNLELLTWAFKKLSSIDAEIEDKTNVARYEKDKIDKWLNSVTEPLEHSKSFFEAKIKEYHEQILLDNPQKKTISTPYGKVKSTRKKAQPIKSNEEELMEYVILNEPDLLKIKKEVNWSELKKKIHITEADEGLIIVDENGQIVSGVSVEEEKVIFKVEVTK